MYGLDDLFRFRPFLLNPLARHRTVGVDNRHRVAIATDSLSIKATQAIATDKFIR